VSASMVGICKDFVACLFVMWHAYLICGKVFCDSVQKFMVGLGWFFADGCAEVYGRLGIGFAEVWAEVMQTWGGLCS
ncbi:hypothetical protein U1Q18_046551, partial [Sarracenia purpurea var. burkii]